MTIQQNPNQLEITFDSPLTITDLPPGKFEPLPATFSILVPTVGRGPIGNLFHSILNQPSLVPGDEVLVIGDGPQPDVERLVAAIDTTSAVVRFRYLQGEVTHDWGHSQLNFALPAAKASHILVQDDDDIYLPRAFSAIRYALSRNPGAPHLFRFYTFAGRLVWSDDVGREVALAKVGGHNLVIPNPPSDSPDRLARIGAGAWTPDYYGDFAWIKSVLSHYPEKSWVWNPSIIVRQRHESKLFDYLVTHPDEAIFTKRLEALRRLRNECRLFMTTFQDEIVPSLQTAFGTSLQESPNLHWAYLFTEKETTSTDFIGFSYVRRDTPHTIPYFTFGLTESARGRGLGRYILQHAIDATMGDLRSEVLASNDASYHLHRSLGFHETARFDGPHGPTISLLYTYPR